MTIYGPNGFDHNLWIVEINQSINQSKILVTYFYIYNLNFKKQKGCKVLQSFSKKENSVFLEIKFRARMSEFLNFEKKKIEILPTIIKTP